MASLVVKADMEQNTALFCSCKLQYSWFKKKKEKKVGTFANYSDLDYIQIIATHGIVSFT